MADIHVQPTEPDVYQVTVAAGAESTSHEVTATADDVARLGGGAGPERLIEESFEFLLEREGPDAILPRFALKEIARYFPEYPQEIRTRMDANTTG